MVKPVVEYAYQQSVLKEEDVLLVNPEQSCTGDKSVDASSSLRNARLNGLVADDFDWSDHSGSTDTADRPGAYGLFVVCDGHNGVTAARYVADQLPAYLDDLLPARDPPAERDSKLHTMWRHAVQRALTVALTLIHRAFAGLGVLAGCTVTIMLQHDWLLTTACLGDSRAVLDTGRSVMMLTEDHRVATHQLERRRLEKKGSIIAPVNVNGGGPAVKKGAVGCGPLRLWPGGLCLSRAIGDFDVGDSVLCLPYISQVIVPESGGRVVLASDGVWDAFDRSSRVTSIHRPLPTQVAPQRVVNAILMTHEGLRDDTSLIVVDIMPPGKVFKECIGPRFHAATGCLCMRGRPSDGEETLPQVVVLEQADIASYAGLMAEKPMSTPAWFTNQLKQDLLAAGAQAMEIWARAGGMRQTGKVPTIVDFEKESLEVGYAIEDTAREATKANPLTSMEDLSVRMGTAAHSMVDPAVLKRKPGHLFPEDNSHHSSDTNPSVRYGNAVVSNSEDFGAKFGHYKRELGEADDDHEPAGGHSNRDPTGVFVPAADVRSTAGGSVSVPPAGRQGSRGGVGDSASSSPTGPLSHEAIPTDDDSSSGRSRRAWAFGRANCSSHAADTAPPRHMSLRRNSIGQVVVPPEHVKTMTGASPPTPGLAAFKGSRPGDEPSKGSREGSAAMPAHEKPHSRRNLTPMTALQRASRDDDEKHHGRIRGGTAMKSVNFA